MSAEKNKLIITSCYQELLNSGNFSEWNDYYDEIFESGKSSFLNDWREWIDKDCVIHLSGNHDILGLEQIKKTFSQMKCANIGLSISHIIAEDNLVSLHGSYHRLPNAETSSSDHGGEYTALSSIRESRVDEGWVDFEIVKKKGS